MKNLKIAILLLPLFILSQIGCTLFTNKEWKVDKVPKELDVVSLKNDITGISNDISTGHSLAAIKSITIGAHAENIMRVTDERLAGDTKDEDEWKMVKNNSSAIIQDVTKQQKILNDSRDAIVKLSKLNYNMLVLKRHLKAIEVNNKAYIEDNKNLRSIIYDISDELKLIKSDITTKTQNMWLYISGLCAIGLIAGIAMVVYGMKKSGITLLGGSLLLLSVAYFVSTYPWVLVIVGGIVVVGVLGFTIYEFSTTHNALEETVMTVETAKHRKWDDAKRLIKKMKVQSKNTKDMIGKIKSKIAK